MTSPESPRDRGKAVLFWVVTLLIPVMIIILTELLLRIMNYEGDVRLVIKRQVGGKEVYSINRAVASKYFSHAGTVIPEPADEIFEIAKQASTKRIFCLGESTMAGFPYEFNATAPSFLRDRLRKELPGFNIEVINVGLSAVGSYVVLDFLQELLDYEPDAIIVYVGHNEFYGAYGVGSSLGVQGSEFLTRASFWLLQFKTFLALRDAVGWVRGMFTPTSKPQQGTLMGEMIGNQIIPWQGDLYRQARSVYGANLRRMIRAAHERNVPIMFSSLVSNVKDHPPFIASFDDRTTVEARSRWIKAVMLGDSLTSAGKDNDAARSYLLATSIDSMHAGAYFKLGRALLRQRKSEAAREAFVRAQDLDVLRFRASSEFQSDLRHICQESAVPLARVDSAFESLSQDRLIGNEIILEHLHPDVRGYFVMGKTFALSLREHHVFSREGWVSPIPDDDSYVNESFVSEFDTLVGRIKIDHLVHQWPFVTTPAKYAYAPKTDVERIVLGYVLGKSAWSQARYELAEWYARKKEFARARRECLAVSKVVPWSYEPLLRVADYYRAEGNTVQALGAYRRCVAAQDNPYARVKIGIIELEREHPAEAITEIENALALEATTNDKFSLQAAATARYLLGVGYAKLGKFSPAKEYLRRAIGLEPRYTEAQELLRQIERFEQTAASGKK